MVTCPVLVEILIGCLFPLRAGVERKKSLVIVEIVALVSWSK